MNKIANILSPREFSSSKWLQASKHGIPKVQSAMMEVGRCGSTEEGNLKPVMKHAWVGVGVGFEESFPQVDIYICTVCFTELNFEPWKYFISVLFIVNFILFLMDFFFF